MNHICLTHRGRPTFADSNKRIIIILVVSKASMNKQLVAVVEQASDWVNQLVVKIGSLMDHL